MRMFILLAVASAFAATLSQMPANAEPTTLNYALGIQAVACSADTAEAQFAIPALADTGVVGHLFNLPVVPSVSYIDLSLFDNGFAPGTFISSGPITSSTQRTILDWPGLRVGTVHYYRINALVGAQWHQIEISRFETPDCYVVQRVACDETNLSTVNVTFRVPYPGILEHAGPVETWLDLSTMPNDFASGTFVGAGPFPVRPPSNQTIAGAPFEWHGISIGWRHYWRTNTLFVPFGWLAQEGGSFLALGCNTLLRVA